MVIWYYLFSRSIFQALCLRCRCLLPKKAAASKIPNVGSVSKGTGVEVAEEKVISLKPLRLPTIVEPLSSEKILKLRPHLPIPVGELRHNRSLPEALSASKVAAVIKPLVTVKEFSATVSQRTASLPISKEPPNPSGKLVIKTVEAAPVLLSLSP